MKNALSGVRFSLIVVASLLLTACASPVIRKAESASPDVTQFRLVSAESSPQTVDFAALTGESPLHLSSVVSLDLSDLVSAEVIRGQFGDYAVRLAMTEAGREKFRVLTGQHIRERLAVISRGKVVFAPVIMEEISGGYAQVTGNYSRQQAEKLAAALVGQPER